MPDLPINSSSFDLISSGAKTLEIRLATEDLTENIKAGDNLIFVNKETGEELVRQVIDTREYSSLEEVVENEDIACAGPFDNNEAFIDHMRKWQTEEDEHRNGVLVISFR